MGVAEGEEEPESAPLAEGGKLGEALSEGVAEPQPDAEGAPEGVLPLLPVKRPVPDAESLRAAETEARVPLTVALPALPLPERSAEGEAEGDAEGEAEAEGEAVAIMESVGLHTVHTDGVAAADGAAYPE